MTKEEDRIVKMSQFLLRSMEISTNECNSGTILSTATNLAINVDRAYTRAEKSVNFIKEMNDIDIRSSTLKQMFVEKCECKRKS